MKTVLAPIIIFSLSTLGASGQQQKNNGRIEFGIGASVPVGNFGKANLGPFGGHVTGAAKTGQALEITYQFSTRSTIDFSLTVFGNRNPINTNELESAYGAKPFGGLSTGPSPNPPSPPSSRFYKNWHFDKASWYSTGLMAGGNINLPINSWKNFSFDAKVRIGAIFGASPELDGYAVTDTSYVIFNQSSKGAFGFCYSLSSGLAHDLNNHTRLHLNLAYLGTGSMKFFDVRTVTIITKGTSSNPQGQEYNSAKTDLTQKINLINILVGVSFIL